MLKRFGGKRALVTGAGSGIGRATALRFAQEGARVIAVDLDPERLETLRAEADGQLETVTGDITAVDLPERLVATAGTVDILANVAGIMDGFLAAGETDDATWDRVLAVNLTAPMRLIRAVIPGMLQQGTGAIVNVASEAGIKGGCAGAAYTASKHGLLGLTRNTAFLYATKGIRTNAVLPGPVATGIQPDVRSQIAIERMMPIIRASISRLATADELAACIVWLASAEANNVNGAVLASDGGWSAV